MRPPVPGDPAPEVTLVDTAGEDWSPQDELRRGYLLLLFFRGSWCFLCRRVLAALREKEKALAEKGCAVAAIAMENAEKLAELRRRLKLAFPLLSDETADAVRAFGVPIERRFDCPFPAVFLIGPDGVIQYRHDGRAARDWPDWDQLIKKLRPCDDTAPQTRRL